MTPKKAPDIHSEDSVFRRLFSDETKPSKMTQTDRMADIFTDAPTREPAIKASDFLPSY